MIGRRSYRPATLFSASARWAPTGTIARHQWANRAECHPAAIRRQAEIPAVLILSCSSGRRSCGHPGCLKRSPELAVLHRGPAAFQASGRLGWAARVLGRQLAIAEDWTR